MRARARRPAARAEVCGAPAGTAAARGALGYLAELFRFPGWASADELLALHQRLAGSDGGAAERAELLELVGLAEARDRRIETMSKGMQQRLGIAQALVGQPRAAAARRADERARPGRAADRPRAARSSCAAAASPCC